MNLGAWMKKPLSHPLCAIAFAVVCVAWPFRAAGANPNDKSMQCEICSDNITNRVFIAYDKIRQVKKHICEKCSKSKTLCASCNLATIPKSQRKLDDGRVLCAQDAKVAVLNEEQARIIYSQVQRDVQDYFKRFGNFPDHNITVHLVNQTDFIKEYFRKPSVDKPEELVGLTRSISEDGTNFNHHIYLLSGLTRAEFEAVCAHEYTHTWLNERSTPARTMNKDTVEGFCELIAWKYATSKGHKLAASGILENNYTRGQIHAMIAAEERYQFHRVIDWIERGMDSWIDKDQLEQVIKLKDKPSDHSVGVPLWQQATARTAVPQTLELRGISGSAKRRFALVNDKTLEVGESAKIRIGSTNVIVHCLAIDETSVTLTIGDAKERRTLALAPKITK